MKNLLIFFWCFTLSGSVVVAQATKKAHVPKPSGFKQEAAIIISNKTRMYYLLSHEKGSVLRLKGPGKLRLNTRAQFVAGQNRTVAYDIVYSINGGTPKTLKVKSVERSDKATFQDGKMGIPGQLKDFEIDIPRGDNTVEIKLGDNKTPVAVRYVFASRKEKKQDWIEFAPVSGLPVVDLISHESTVSYYRFTDATPLKIDIIGPTQIRVFTRPEFNYQMRGKINYRLQVSNQGKVMNTFQLSSRHSEIAKYKSEKELVPGKASEFVIDVPAGKQTYEIMPLDKDKGSILGRMLIVRKDVKKTK